MTALAVVLVALGLAGLLFGLWMDPVRGWLADWRDERRELRDYATHRDAVYARYEAGQLLTFHEWEAQRARLPQPQWLGDDNDMVRPMSVRRRIEHPAELHDADRRAL